MKRIYSFEPIEDRNAEVLILGSMPGRASLMAGQYYAHAQNAFWRIISELLHLDAGASYRMRVQALISARIALWDVLHSCSREGSLDSRIEPGTQTANDFPAFFRSHRKIARVFFNGATAEHVFRRQVLRGLNGVSASYARLPSTSPAYAAVSFADKLGAWRAILLDQRRRQLERRATH
ncbi:MAG: DNA-deoxyinosine glycosylase [Betaproteobacteria bacterium]|nr:DNA-deoxyinosine glycosylase [Betaproteobacteria bacterium]